MIDSNLPDDDPPRDPFAMLAALHKQEGHGGGMRHYVLDGREVKAVPMMQWARWLEKFEDRIVGKTDVGPVSVSTVFLGLDHQWGNGPPLLFETMVFGGLTFDQDQWRYSTYDEAEAGHAAIVAMVQAHYRPWWLRAWETAAAWTKDAWRHTIEEDEWDWSIRQWIHNTGAFRARIDRWKRQGEWSIAQRESALAVAESNP